MAANEELSRIQHRRGLQVNLSGIVLNSGELGWSADERRLFIGNRTAEDAPVDENVEILTEYSSLNAANVTKTFVPVTMSVLGVDTTFLTVDSTTDNRLIFQYKMTQGAVERMGTFRVISDGTSVAVDDSSVEVGGASTVTLGATMSGSNILIHYNATGSTGTLSYFLESI